MKYILILILLETQLVFAQKLIVKTPEAAIAEHQAPLAKENTDKPSQFDTLFKKVNSWVMMPKNLLLLPNSK